jgi:hypothetical protein
MSSDDLDPSTPDGPSRRALLKLLAATAPTLLTSGSSGPAPSDRPTSTRAADDARRPVEERPAVQDPSTDAGPPAADNAHSSEWIDNLAGSAPEEVDLFDKILMPLETAGNVVDYALPRKFRKPGPTLEPQFGPSFIVDGVEVRPIQIEHTGAMWQAHGGRIREELADADHVVLEYLPNEYDHLRRLPIVGNHIRQSDNANALFDELAVACEDAHKDVWTLDPAYGLALGAIFNLGQISERLGRVVTPQHLAVNLPALLTGKQYTVLTFATIFAGMTAAQKFPQATEEVLESDLRRVVTAQHLHDLCRSSQVEKGASILVVYPAGHWKPNTGRPGIEQYLLDDDLRESRFALYKGLFGRVTPSIFASRHYPDGACTNGPQPEVIDVIPNPETGSPRPRTRSMRRIRRTVPAPTTPTGTTSKEPEVQPVTDPVAQMKPPEPKDPGLNF